MPARDPNGPTLGLALIVRNEEESLPRLLESIEGVFDRIAVVDTGSTDKTAEVFAKWALRERKRREKVGTLRYVYKDGVPSPLPFYTYAEFFEANEGGTRDGRLLSFAEARQHSWDLLGPVDLAVWADADDTIQNAAQLRALADNLPPNAGGLIFPYDYAHDPHGNVICRLERERLVRKGIGEAWQLPVHEVLHIPPQFPLVRTDAVVWVHHKKPDSQDPERNYKILQADLARSEEAGEAPNPRTLIYLGTELLALNKPAEAIPWLIRYLDVGEWDEELCQAAHKLSLGYRMLHDQGEAGALDDAEAAARLAIQHRPDWPEGYLGLAEVALRRQQPDKALRLIEQAKLKPAPQTLLITNPMDYSLHPMLMESAARLNLGQAEEAFELTLKALEIAPREDIQMQASGLAEEVKTRDTAATVLKLYELLVRHDENLKAQQLLDAAPYYVWDHPAIAEARRNARENVLHATDFDLYSSFYRDNPNEAPFELQQVKIEDAHERFRRVAFLREGLEDQRKQEGRQQLRVLDLSGNDGWMVANLATANYSCDMLEMNPEPVERARGRAKKYAGIKRVECGNLYDAPEIFEPGSYDAVCCFETIEHVQDTDGLLDTMAKMVRPGGRCYISTPDGAFERGQDPVMANWHVVEAKGHLRAIRPDEMAGWLCERGIVEGFELEQRLIHAAWTPDPRQGRIVFYGGSAEALPEKITSEGLGGSETALCKLAEQFARKGYDVRVFAGNGDAGLRGDHVTTGGEELTGQVLYAPGHAWDPGLECDLFVSSRVPEAFDRTVKAKRSLLWLHDADYGERITAQRIERVDDVIVLSEYQRDLFAGRYPFLGEKLFVSSNAIEPEFFKDPKPLAERKPWVVYSSSPDRGLDVLLECWPEIRERVPEAELHCGYPSYYKQVAAAFPYLKAFDAKLQPKLAQEGVVDFGSLPQQELAKLYQAARVWAYPSWTGYADDGNGAPFPEISCISAMEAQAGGCVPVTAAYAALNETVTTGTALTGIDRGADWRRTFIDEIVRYLTDDKDWEKHSLCGQTAWADSGWEDVAAQWEERFIGCRDCDCEPPLALPRAKDAPWPRSSNPLRPTPN